MVRSKPTRNPYSGADNLGMKEIVDGAYLLAERAELVTVEESRA